MVAFEQSLAAEFDGAFIEDGPLAWVARNSSKPGRPSTPECWVLHAKPDWTTEQLEADSDSVAAKLTEVFFAAASVSPVQPHHLAAHRWRYARAAVPGSEGCLLDDQARLAVCGDWLHGDRIEGAFLSGLAAAEQLHALLATS
jgi:predicted NAD/FAD-dependent oxidoreductase